MNADDEMWTRKWMSQHFAELGPLGQKFATYLQEGCSIQEATMRHTMDAMEAQTPWDELTEFEQLIHHKMEENYKAWKAGEGQRH